MKRAGGSGTTPAACVSTSRRDPNCRQDADADIRCGERQLKQDINRWWTVVGGALCLSVGAGVISAFMFGTFIKAIAAQSGWSRAQVSLGLTIFEFAMGPGTIVLGSLIDRFGVRRPTLFFLAWFALSIALVGVIPVSLPLFCLAFVMVGFFAPGSNALPYAKVVCARFDRPRLP